MISSFTAGSAFWMYSISISVFSSLDHLAGVVQPPCERLTKVNLAGRSACIFLIDQVQQGGDGRAAGAKAEHIPAGAAKIILADDGVQAGPEVIGSLACPSSRPSSLEMLEISSVIRA